MKASVYRSKSVLFYCLFRFFEDFGLIYPVYLILFQRQGLSYLQISLLLAAWTGTMLVLEVPSGLLADLWSRKAVIALGTVLKAAGFLVWALKPDFTGFLLGFLAWGAEEAFCSGTTEAMLFEALRRERRESAYEAAAGIAEEDEPAPCRPSREPGFMPLPSPVPTAIEQADPGGVSCTKRILSLTL